MTVINTAVSTVNYLFLQTVAGNINNENINEELEMFIYDLSEETDTLDDIYVQEFKREIAEGPYFDDTTKDEAGELLDCKIKALTGDHYPNVTQFYISLIPFDPKSGRK